MSAAGSGSVGAAIRMASTPVAQRGNMTSSEPDALALWDALAAEMSLLGDVTYAGELDGQPRKGSLFHWLSSDDWDTAVTRCGRSLPPTIAHVNRALMLGLRPCRKCWPALGGVAPARKPREAVEQAAAAAVNAIRPLLAALDIVSKKRCRCYDGVL